MINQIKKNHNKNKKQKKYKKLKRNYNQNKLKKKKMIAQFSIIKFNNYSLILMN